MPGIVDVHWVNQQEIGIVLQAQAFGILEQMRVGVTVVPVEMAVLDRQVGRVSVAITRGVKRRAVIQFAHPVISGCGGSESGVARIVEDTALSAQAIDAVVNDAAAHRRNAGQNAFVQRTRQRRQFAG